MPLGESIGDAYVRVHANGEDVRVGINDSFDGLEDDLDRRGREGGEAYRRGWSRSLDLFRDDLRRSLNDNLTDFGRGLDRNRVMLEGSESRVERLRRSLADLSDETDRNRRSTDGSTTAYGQNARIMDQLRDRIRGTADALGDSSRATEDWRRQMHELNTETEEGNRQISQRQRSLATFDRLQRKYNMDFSELIEINRRGIAQTRQENDARDVQIRSLQRLIHEQENGNRSSLLASRATDIHRISIDRLSESTRRLADDQDRVGDSTDRTRRRFDLFHRSVDRFNNTGIVTTMRRMGDEGDRNNRVFGRLNNHVNRFSDIVGRGFGRGSRNNFLNFMGSMARGFIRLIGLIPKALDLVTTFAVQVGKNMATSFTNAGGGLSGMAAAAATLGVEMIALAPVIGAVVVAMAAAVLIIGPLVSLMSALAAAAVALAASLTFAIVGALAPLLGLIAPLGIGVGVLAAAFLGLDKAAKKALKEAVKPLKEELGKLGDIARKPILDAITENAKKLVPLFQNLRPLVQKVSEAFGGLIDDFGKAADNKGSGLNKFIDRMTKFAPNAIAKLGESMGNFLSGLLGVFRALTGPVNEFLGWLQQITDEFDNWANSRKGQKAMKNFFEEASDSASALWGLLGAIKDILVTLFDSGKGDGDNIITTMTDKIKEFNKFLKDHPDALKKWFDLGEKTVGQLGSIAVSLGEIADELDNDKSRKNLGETLNSIGDAVEGIDNVIGALQTLETLIGGLLTLGNPLSAIFDTGAIPDLGKLLLPDSWVTNIGISLGKLKDGFMTGFNNVLTAIGDFFIDVSDAFGKGIGSLGNIFGGGSGAGGGGGISTMMITGFTSWMPGVLSLLGGFGASFTAVFSGLPERVTGFFDGLASRIGDAIGHFDLRNVIHVPEMSFFWSKFVGLAQTIGDKIGIHRLLENIHIPSMSQIWSHFVGLANTIGDKIGIHQLLENIHIPAMSQIWSKFVGLAKTIGDKIGIHNLIDNIHIPLMSTIANQFSGLAGLIKDAIGSIDIFPTIHWPSLGGNGKGPSDMDGNNPSRQSLTAGGSLSAGGGIPLTPISTGSSKTFINTFHITSPNDPRAVANELLNQLVATAY